jgi:hypothetical protein
MCSEQSDSPSRGKNSHQLLKGSWQLRSWEKGVACTVGREKSIELRRRFVDRGQIWRGRSRSAAGEGPMSACSVQREGARWKPKLRELHSAATCKTARGRVNVRVNVCSVGLCEAPVGLLVSQLESCFGAVPRTFSREKNPQAMGALCYCA